MKIHSLIIEILIFFAVSCFLIIPPMVSGFGGVTETIIFQWNFPLSQFFLALVALFLFIYYSKLRKSKINILGFRIIFTVSLLFLSFFILSFLARILPIRSTKTLVEIALPNSVLKWIFCILNFVFAAFYEEVIYRFYFTDTLISITAKINPIFEKKIFRIVFEVLGCVVFAFAHSYMGIYAIINAAIAHFVLRYTFKKSNSIIPGFIAHFIYNIVSLFII